MATKPLASGDCPHAAGLTFLEAEAKPVISRLLVWRQ